MNSPVRAAVFEKVSESQYTKSFKKLFPDTDDTLPERIYGEIKLPKRATAGSAGYDFYAPFEIELKPEETVTVPTGIRARMREDFVLLIFPRSGLGFRYRLQLNNTVGVIDSDYYGSDNEGHIMIRITNDSKEGKTLKVAEGEGFAQGIFIPFGVTEDDCASEIRNGGFGSTTSA